MLLPPESVFTPCEQPTLQGNTWGDAVSYTLALQTVLSVCSGQVTTLNQWRSSLLRYGQQEWLTQSHKN
ncbi:Rz1-like lysis system protein LysC [Serratia grimesii]|uniref:Rz1-like lysis system protein LysC n=1 Tax=Serratia grimesii TaxID=82995 RepID=UPI003B50F4C8